MKRVSCRVKIGDYVFSGVNQVNVESSWDMLTDTCKITIPRKIEWEGKALATGQMPLLQRGQKVSIELGYDDANELVYQGYIIDVSAKIPTEITCEDDFFLLKKGEFTKSYRKVSLIQLLADLFKGTGIKYKVVADRDLGQFKISKATPAKVLNYLRENYHVKFFFRNGIFYAGLFAVPELQQTHDFFFEPTAKSKDFQFIKENDLTFKRKEDLKIKLVGIIKQEKGKDKKIEIGDDEGETRTFHYPNISEAAVKKQLIEQLERLKYDGYRGTMTVFGVPQVQHGDLVNLYDPTYPERDGRYLVKKVSRSYGVQGSQQTLELEQKY